MKLKLLSCIALLTGLCASQALALFPNPWVTIDNPWDENIIGYQVTYQAGKPGGVYWDGTQPTGDFPHGDGPYTWTGGRADNGSTAQYYLEEMGTDTDDGKTFVLRPETNFFVYNPFNSTITVSNTFRNAGETDGDKYVDSLTFYEREIIGTETNVQMDFVVNDFDFDTNRYEVAAFFKVVVVNTGASVFLQETNLASLTLGATNTFQLATNYVQWNDGNHNIQLGFRVSGTNASPAAALSLGSANVTVTDLFLEAPDFLPPQPDPLTWEVVPYPLGDDKISMTATTATDVSGVEYQFTGYLGGIPPGKPLAFQSAWQDSPTYVASGLAASTTYGIRAQARDKASTPNLTLYTPWATPATGATDPNIPTPNPAQIASIQASPVNIWMVATPATDASVVEYNFTPANTNNGAVASGWQLSNEFVLYDTVPETLYTYRVQVRDLSAATNTTTISNPANVVTPAAPGAVSITNDLKGFTAGSTPSGALLTALGNAGFEVASLDASKPIYADSNGLTFGNFAGTNGTFADRNILRTIADNYGANDFTIDVTFSYSNQAEQVCFTGAGYGIQGEFNVPDFFIVDTNFYLGGGVNAVLTETSAAWQKLFSFKDGEEVVPIFGDGTTNTLIYAPGVGSITNRVRLTYVAATSNATYEIDYDADGIGGPGDFFPDLTLGPVTLTNVFNGSEPSKLYVSAGAGTTLYDLAITAAGGAAIAVDDLTITSVSGNTATLQWTRVSGQTYNVLYKTALTAGSWTADGPNQGLSGTGTLTTTSTVVADQVFYQVESE